MLKRLTKIQNRFDLFCRYRLTYFYKGTHKYDLIIYDDIFPHPVSGFRLEEISSLLSEVKNSKAVLLGSAYKILKSPISNHKKDINKLKNSQKNLRNKLQLHKGPININASLFYCVFLNNIYRNLKVLEKYEIPFVFTLYPGGGFTTDQSNLIKLKTVLSSKCFRKVIVTQRHTYNFLINNKLCSENGIAFIFGVVVPQNSLYKDLSQKKFFGTNKKTFDICFCAAKYSKSGEDKGYPVFIEFVKRIAPKYNFINFHVVGGFTEHDMDVQVFRDRITFHGYQNFESLGQIFTSMDLIISPNQPNKLGNGTFDGFPLGTVIEAAFHEVVIMLTDCLAEDIYFEDGKELVVIKPEVDDMIAKFEMLLGDIDSFYSIARKGKEKFRHIYSNDFQMCPRINLLNEIINGVKKT